MAVGVSDAEKYARHSGASGYVTKVTVIAESGGWYFAQDLTNTLRFVIAAVPRARRLDTMRFKARSAGAGENGRAMVAGLGHWLRSSSCRLPPREDLFG